MTGPATVALVAYAIALLRILAYRRNGARHRPHISWLAWVLLVSLGGSVIQILLHARAVTVFEAAMAVLMALFVLGVRGNVARLLRGGI